MSENTPDTIEPTPAERREQRMFRMEREFTLAQKNLANLSQVLPGSWVADKLIPANCLAELEDYGDKLDKANTALVMYAEAIGQDPAILPDTHRGDRRELNNCFNDVIKTIKALTSLLPPGSRPQSFIQRLQRKETHDHEEGGVATQTAPEEEKPKRKKDDGAYKLPGLYERTIRDTIIALESYAAFAAPLVGAVYEKREMIGFIPEPGQKVFEMHEFTFERTVTNPADFGTPDAWTRALDLKVGQSRDDMSAGPASLGT